MPSIPGREPPALDSRLRGNDGWSRESASPVVSTRSPEQRLNPWPQHAGLRRRESAAWYAKGDLCVTPVAGWPQHSWQGTPSPGFPPAGMIFRIAFNTPDTEHPRDIRQHRRTLAAHAQRRDYGREPPHPVVPSLQREPIPLSQSWQAPQTPPSFPRRRGIHPPTPHPVRDDGSRRWEGRWISRHSRVDGGDPEDSRGADPDACPAAGVGRPNATVQSNGAAVTSLENPNTQGPNIPAFAANARSVMIAGNHGWSRGPRSAKVSEGGNPSRHAVSRHPRTRHVLPNHPSFPRRREPILTEAARAASPPNTRRSRAGGNPSPTRSRPYNPFAPSSADASAARIEGPAQTAEPAPDRGHRDIRI